MENIALKSLLEDAKVASRELSKLTKNQIDNALNLMANELLLQKEE